jgi:hypothetical protein
VNIAPAPKAGVISFRAQLDRWLQGLAQAITQGGAVSVKAFFGAAGANALGLGVQALDLKQMLAVFLVGAAYHFFDYLATNPLPDVAATSTQKPITKGKV